MTGPATVAGTVVVAGGSMAGLLAAAAAHEAADRVVVVDRDELGDEAAPRAGTPQATHAHGLLASGAAAIETLLPGITDELLGVGALSGGDIGGAGRWWIGGGLLADCELGLDGLAVSRPLLEWVVRRRVRGLPGVEVRDHADVVGLTIDGAAAVHRSAGRVSGVRVRDRSTGAEEHLPAELVLDATGRPARSRGWLTELGWTPPTQERERVGVRYATTHLESRAGDLEGRLVSVNAATPQVPRGGVALQQEGRTWVITLFGYGDTQPPLDPDGFRAFARTLVSPDVADLLDSRELLHAPRGYRFPDCRRHRWESALLPLGHAAIGDAICSFDPTFGQGMTVAALEAVALREVLVADGSVQSYHRQAARIVDRAWALVVGAARQLPCLDAEPGLVENLVARYVARAQRAAHADPVVAHRLMRITNLLDAPPRLMDPRLWWRVARAA